MKYYFILILLILDLNVADATTHHPDLSQEFTLVNHNIKVFQENTFAINKSQAYTNKYKMVKKRFNLFQIGFTLSLIGLLLLGFVLLTIKDSFYFKMILNDSIIGLLIYTLLIIGPILMLSSIIEKKFKKFTLRIKSKAKKKIRTNSNNQFWKLPESLHPD